MKQLLKFIAMIVECLPELDSQVIQGWIENPKALRKVLAGALQPTSRFEIWKTINTRLQNAIKLCRAIESVGGRVAKNAKEIMTMTSFIVPESRQLNLVRVSVAGLGFPSGATLEEIYERAISMGLVIVPADTGAQLRCQYLDQPNGERLVMAMTVVNGSRVFIVECDSDVFWLRTDSNGLLHIWDSGSVFVFCMQPGVSGRTI